MVCGGFIIFDYLLDENEDMYSFLLIDSSILFIGGLQNYILEIDFNIVQEIQKYVVEMLGVIIMRQINCFFFCGYIFGKVFLRDFCIFKVEYEFDVFLGSFLDFDVYGNLLVFCGFFSCFIGLVCDCFFKVYDLCMMCVIILF